MMSTNSGFRDAPPTRKPSTSPWDASSLQLAPVTEPARRREEKRRWCEPDFKSANQLEQNSEEDTQRREEDHLLNGLSPSGPLCPGCACQAAYRLFGEKVMAERKIYRHYSDLKTFLINKLKMLWLPACFFEKKVALEVKLHRLDSQSLTSVDDAHGVGHVVRHVGSEPRPQLLMDLLSLDTHTHTIVHRFKMLSPFSCFVQLLCR